MPAKLSVNLNKYALLRNSRGGNAPDLMWAADLVIGAGAEGITLHPRLDQRHVRFDDVPRMAAHLRRHHPAVELNIECEPEPGLVAMVVEIGPDQCTLVPVTPGEVTSDHGWELPGQAELLSPVLRQLRDAGIRTSCFADCDPQAMAAFAALGMDRVELYTGPYATAWGTAEAPAQTERVLASARAAAALGLGVNAGHDLDRHNLAGLIELDVLLEVSIGHAQICRALEVGTRVAVQELLTALNAGRAAPSP